MCTRQVAVRVAHVCLSNRARFRLTRRGSRGSDRIVKSLRRHNTLSIASLAAQWDRSHTCPRLITHPPPHKRPSPHPCGLYPELPNNFGFSSSAHLFNNSKYLFGGDYRTIDPGFRPSVGRSDLAPRARDSWYRDYVGSFLTLAGPVGAATRLCSPQASGLLVITAAGYNLPGLAAHARLTQVTVTLFSLALRF
ncbi:hypothetical protein GOBAR_AA14280 [Gossypium barbadense]|uniref:Uncharacterized protein n=1 Tax=Gossypium barbadense TaxID=3634 RepID=A0A2P5XSV9_GOSBA|nr:hypothetical protein GOBAR_AA14280 [Gossypium barbadense]